MSEFHNNPFDFLVFNLLFGFEPVNPLFIPNFPFRYRDSFAFILSESRYILFNILEANCNIVAFSISLWHNIARDPGFNTDFAGSGV